VSLTDIVVRLLSRRWIQPSPAISASRLFAWLSSRSPGDFARTILIIW